MSDHTQDHRSVINILADLLLPVLFMAAQYFMGFIRNPMLRLAGAVGAALLVIVYLVAARQVGRAARIRMLAISLVLAGLVFGVLLWWSPFCSRDMVVNFEVVRQASSPETVFGSRQLEVEPDDQMMVQAVIVGLENDSEITCLWHYNGDGYIENSMGCITFLRSGTDLVEDSLVVEVQQVGCRWHTTNGFFLSPQP